MSSIWKPDPRIQEFQKALTEWRRGRLVEFFEKKQLNHSQGMDYIMTKLKDRYSDLEKEIDQLVQPIYHSKNKPVFNQQQ